MLHIENLHATVGDKRNPLRGFAASRESNIPASARAGDGHYLTRSREAAKGITSAAMLSLLASCSFAPAAVDKCISLKDQRDADVQQLMAEAHKIDPKLTIAEREKHPSFKDSQFYMNLQAKLEAIDNRFFNKCPAGASNAAH